MEADILRQKFLDFFESKKHKIIESDSLIPQDDPTVLFTPAGMNQFKKEFMGFDSGFKKAATSQRCLRTDDLDKVGKTASHLTFFEMLGNFSFGNYFKKEAILWAWEFLTKELKMDAEKLLVSVYKDDDEAYNIWKELVGLSIKKIIKLGDKHNFWPQEAKEKGPNGPCGPCSEIFFDSGIDKGCRKSDCSPACDCGRFVEVWNLVFTQYNRLEGGTLEPLPKKNIDTGMGLERLTAIMQGAPNNFETDLFKPIIKEITLYPLTTIQSPLIYAIADHIRAITFAIYDGVMPSNEARGYVVRKIIRKSVLHLKALGITKPFLYKLVSVLAKTMKQHYPELSLREENISEIILSEEKNFFAVLDSSETLFKAQFQKALETTSPSPEEVGKITFQLHDTYGLPYELTTAWLEKHNIKISKNTFDQELTRQKERSRLQSAMKGDVFNAKSIDYGVKETKFLGYKELSIETKIIKIIREGSLQTKKITKGEEATIILEKSVFYPESGGQAGDIGEIVKGKNCFEVLDTKKIGKIIAHIGRVKEGSFKTDHLIRAKINKERRLSTARNHTATHLLQAALRKVLGPHVKQQGSLVTADKLRFDFQHFKDIDKEQLSRIEAFVNSCVMNNFTVDAKQKSLQEAKKEGALAFFSEKYKNKVRIISVAADPANGGVLSKELCAGTHLNNTGQIGLFKILRENSVASGIRRIEALTGTSAYKLIETEEETLNSVSSELGVPRERITQELEKKLKYIKELEGQLNRQKINNITCSTENLIQSAEVINNIKVITSVTENLDMNLLRKNVDLVKGKTDNCIIALGSKNKEGALLVIGITKDLCGKGWDASKLIRDVTKIIGGSGGGRADFAQAGGNNPENFQEAFEKLKNIIHG